jgi:hypothetical protein
VALLQNGVSAESGNFLQAACTTSANKTWEHVAAGACLVGAPSIEQEEVGEIEFMYGVLKMEKNRGQ